MVSKLRLKKTSVINMLSSYIAHKKILACGKDINLSSLCSHIEESKKKDHLFLNCLKSILNLF